MATTGHVFCRLALQNANNFLIKRFYSIRPPARLGGKIWRKFKGKSHDEALTFADKFARSQRIDPDLVAPVNIGAVFSADIPGPAERRRVLRENRKDEQMEYQARHQELTVPLDSVRDDWVKEFGPHHVRTIVDHYGIYRDLFGPGAYFIPTHQMTVAYDYDDDLVTRVFYGNPVSPTEASSAPHVEFQAEEDSLYTLLMTNPDGHLTDNDSEYIHWFIGNIPGGDVSQGQVICDYLKPFPPQGTGAHRHVFLLFKQAQRIDFSTEQRPGNCTSLAERTFRTLEWYRPLQDQLTPVSVNFFQAEWDESVRDVYHNTLNMREPKFEFQHPPPYHPPPVTYPKNEPFDRYYDRYRDKKDLAEEVLRLKLTTTSPYHDHPPRPKYPLTQRPTSYKPSWLRRKEELMHRRLEQFKDLP